MNQFDIAIVGAGPAGSSTAIRLAQHGYRVALIDRAIFPRDKLCGDFLNPTSWPILDGLEVSDDLLARPHAKISTFRMSAASGAAAVSALPVQGARQFGLGLRRFHLDHVLLERAKQVGVSVRQGVKVTGVDRDSRGWRLAVDHGDHPSSAQARFLVGADGRNSWVARQLGVLSPRAQPSSAVGFEVQLKNVQAVRHSVEIHQFTGGYAGLVRVDEHTVNLCFTVRLRQLGKARSFEQLREHLLGANPLLQALLVDAETVSPLRSVWPVYFPRRRCFGAGFLLVGDAARVTEPVTGEGIYFALRSGQLAATTIAAALREGNVTPARLSQYDGACRTEFRARLWLNTLIRRLMYRPKLLSIAIRLLGIRKPLLETLVNTVCQPHGACGVLRS